MSGIHTGLAVGIPLCGRPVMPEWALALATQDWPMGLNVTYMSLKGLEVGVARNQIAQHALDQGAEFLWFIDDDTAPPSYACKRLLRVLREDPETAVVGGIYCNKAAEPEPIVFQTLGGGVDWRWKAGDVFPCAGLGTGCMMIRTRVFRDLPEPWFLTVDADCPGPSIRERGGQTQQKETDDLYFCRKLAEHGHRIKAHGGVLCLHWDAATGRAYALPADSYPVQPLVTEAA